MIIAEKFQKGIKTHTYRRTDSNYKVNIFLGYNENGQMSMVVTEPGKVVKTKSSKVIDVNLKRREDGKLALTFDLLDDTYETMFVVFCKDVIVACEVAGKEVAIATALKRWKYWKDMFGKQKSVLLDKSEIKGLIGELIQLKQFINEHDSETAIKSWMGPLLGHKDFELFNTWYEVKSVNEAAIQVTISSLEQLESNVDGHLVVIRLEDTNTLPVDAINLNKIVLEITDLINDPDIMNMFCTKLDSVGYISDPAYDEVNFLYKGTHRYLVNDKFPRLRRETVGDAIGNVKYTILFEGITRFLED